MTNNDTRKIRNGVKLKTLTKELESFKLEDIIEHKPCALSTYCKTCWYIFSNIKELSLQFPEKKEDLEKLEDSYFDGGVPF